MRIYHFSDPHFSFVPLLEKEVPIIDPLNGWKISDGRKVYWIDGKPYKCQKPMNQRKRLVGSVSYNNYIEKLKDQLEEVMPTDVVVITGDLTHDMAKSKVEYTLKFIDSLPGIKVIIRGNHDWGWDFGKLRVECRPKSTFMIEEGGIQAIGPYMFGCWSNHQKASTQVNGQQPGFCNDHFMLHLFATALKDMADRHKKVPILLSHYPVPLEEAQYLGKQGIRAYLSGHTHCSQAAPEPNWTWYDATAGQTDGQTIEGCFFSTGSTDVQLHKRNGRMIREIQLAHHVKKAGPKPHNDLPKFKGVAAPEITLLCGVPGSGKSTYAAELSNATGWKVICRDELGTRDACVRAAGKELCEGRPVIVDMTNINVPMRHYWVSLARHYKVKCINCIFWTPDADTCIKRCQGRIGHPTMSEKIPDDRKAEIVMQFVRQFKEPSKDEGFHNIIQIK